MTVLTERDTLSTASNLDVSVVITTRNRADELTATLDSLARQAAHGFVWEIVVIDNGSTDATSEVLKAAAPWLPLVSYRHEPAGKCRAQNVALERVRGALVVFTDDDVTCAPGWLDALWRAAQIWPDADLFGGAIRVRLIGTTPAWLAGEAGRTIIERHCAQYHPRRDEGYTEVPPIGPNMAVRRRALGALRFDENVGPDGTHDYIKGGDTDLNQALMARSHRCVFVPDAVIEHHAYADRLRLATLFEGAYRRGRKNAYLYPTARRGLHIAGAPLSLWLKIIKQGLRYKLSGRSPRVRQYALGMKFSYRLGYLRQLKTCVNDR